MFSTKSIMVFHGSWIIEQNNVKNKTNIKDINLFTSSFVFFYFFAFDACNGNEIDPYLQVKKFSKIRSINQ